MEPYHNLTVLPSNSIAHPDHTVASFDRALKHTSGNVQGGSLESHQTEQTKSILRSQSRINVKSESDHRDKPVKGSCNSTQTAKKRKPSVNPYHSYVPAHRRGTEQYLAYREKQRRPSSKGVVWPDDLEEAFHEALEIIGPKGREKTMFRGRSLGKNQIISIYLLERSGKVRSRKQISSHLQVLRNFNKDNPEFLDKIIRKDPASENASAKAGPYEDCNRFSASDGPDLDHASFTNIKFEEHIAPYATSLSTSRETASIYGTSSLTHSRVYDLDFKMWVEPRQAMPMAQPQRHVYTEVIHRTRCSTESLESIHAWRSTFPQLAALEQKKDLDCEIVLLETSLNFVSDYPPQNSTLGVQFQIVLSGEYAYNDWSCTTNIYTQDGQYCAISRDSPVRQLPSRKQIVKGKTSTDAAEPIIVTPQFESAFWSELFTDLMHQRTCYDQNGDVDGLRQQAAATRRCIRGISAMQELYTRPSEGSPSQRVAIFLWQFRQAKTNEPGTTIWRNLVPPCAQILPNSPLMPKPQPPMILRGALQESALECAVNCVDPFDHNQLGILEECHDAVPHGQLDMLDEPETGLSETPPDLVGGTDYPVSSYASTQDSGPTSSFASTEEGGEGDTNFTGGHINLYYEPASLETCDGDPPCFSLYDSLLFADSNYPMHDASTELVVADMEEGRGIDREQAIQLI